MVNQQNINNDRFWSSFNRIPDVRGKKILEIGCGSGERCQQLVRMGAREVVGLDIIESEILEARVLLENEDCIDRNACQFHCGELNSLTETNFDIVVSENTFEHVIDIEGLLEDIYDKCVSGAEVYLGFGPLYYSPYGDHGWMRAVLPFRKHFSWPWGHVVFPEKYVFKRLSEENDVKIADTTNWPYLALNKKEYSDYLECFQKCPLKLDDLALNPGYSLTGRFMRFLSKIPIAQKYTVWGIFAVLRKD